MTTAAVSVRCGRIGTSSYVLEGEIQQDGRLVAEVATTFVLLDTESGRSQPMPDDMRNALISDHEAHGLTIET
jgi:acyl-CoA thioesterase FadM